MTQSVPVTRGATYEISFWVRADDLTKDALKIGLIKKGKPTADVITIDSGSFDWKQFQFSVVAEADTLPVSIWAQGTGQALVDDMQIRMISKPN